MQKFITLGIALTLSWVGLIGQAPATADSEGAIQLAQAREEEERGEGAKEEALSALREEGIMGRTGGAPEEGEVAPDFELIPLKFYEFGIDKAEITEENAGMLYQPVKLSSFRGKKPVVLIFGSYT